MHSIHHITESVTKYLRVSGSKLCGRSTKANTQKYRAYYVNFQVWGKITSNKLNQYGLLHLFMYASQLQHSYMNIQNFIKD